MQQFCKNQKTRSKPGQKTNEEEEDEKILHDIVAEVLLKEEVFGAQAFVYHGSQTEPDVMLDILRHDEFEPGRGSGSMYGNGLYAIYEPDENSPTFQGQYGPFVYKLKFNLNGFIIFDADICRKVYGKEMTAFEQLDMLGLHKVRVRAETYLNNLREDMILNILNDIMHQENKKTFTSEMAGDISHILNKHVKGIVFTGRRDGKVAIIYDTSTVVPVAWKTVELTADDLDNGIEDVSQKKWQPFDKHMIRPAISRSVAGTFTPARFNKDEYL